MGSVYALVALGFHIIYNGTRAINFAQGEQVVLGGVIALSCMSTLKLPLPLAFFLTLIIGGVIGYFYERLAIRPNLETSELSIIISSIAVAIILQNSIAVIWEKDPMYFPPFTKGGSLEFMGAYMLRQSLWIMGITAASVVALDRFFHQTLLGKAILASANNSEAARLVGISPFRMVSCSFILSGCLGAIAGSIVAPLTFAGGPLGTMIAIKGFAGGILGGLSSSRGVVLGALLLGILEFFIATFISEGYRDAIAIFILLIALMLKPEGLFAQE